MSTPVVTDQWAGNFDCSVCHRKRLVAAEFSKKSIEKYNKTGAPLKCKACVQAAEQEERAAAAAKRAAKSGDEPSSSERRTCAACHKELEQSSFNKNQWNKGEGKSRCRPCVEQALQDEASQQGASKEAALSKAKQDVANAKAKGSASAILKAESVLAALEAEHVTGLKPIKMKNTTRRGGGGRGGSGRGRGRGGSRR